MRLFFQLLLSSFLCIPLVAQDGKSNSTPVTPLKDPSFFPIAVWLQNPNRAEEYKAAGINTYVALWHGPTEEQIKTLEKAGMHLVCSQNSLALQNRDNPMILAWMHGDEPDNAQSLPSGKGYGPPILPEVIYRDYLKMKKADPSRPILLNLGQGVAWDNYIGRGVRRNHPEDYPDYLKGCDIASFDIYPAVHDNKEIAGKLEYVAKGVQRLVQWSKGEKEVWNCIECTRISNVDVKPTPAQVKSEVWMSLIHGSKGLIYFVHQFKPNFREAALLDDPQMVRAVTEINTQIKDLAPILNSPSVNDILQNESAAENPSIASMVKQKGKDIYLFTVEMENKPGHAKLKISGASAGMPVQVIGEDREIRLKEGMLEDNFKGYEVHLYKFSKS
jgi:hypothetical protein